MKIATIDIGENLTPLFVLCTLNSENCFNDVVTIARIDDFCSLFITIFFCSAICNQLWLKMQIKVDFWFNPIFYRIQSDSTG